jgi:hypothetical protein
METKELNELIEAQDTLDASYVSNDEQILVRQGADGSLRRMTRADLRRRKLITANYNAEDGDELIVNTASTALVITLPAYPQTGSIIEIVDSGTSWAVNPPMINRNGRRIDGATENLIPTSDVTGLTLVYTGAVVGWKTVAVVRGRPVLPTVASAAMTAVAGQLIAADTSEDSFTILLPATPASGTSIEILDATYTWSVNSLIIDGNGKRISAELDDFECDVSIPIRLYFVNDTVGWVVIPLSPVSGMSAVSPIGYDPTMDKNYRLVFRNGLPSSQEI